MFLRILLTAVAIALLGATPPASAPPPAAKIDVDKVTCNDLIKAAPLDRAAVVMFYWGYAAAKAGASSFKTPVLETATEHLMRVCSKNPNETMINAVRDTDIKAF
jgi:hypothetical protein